MSKFKYIPNSTLPRYSIRKTGEHYDVIDNKERTVRVGLSSRDKAMEYIKNSNRLITK